MNTDYRIETTVLRTEEPFLVECWIRAKAGELSIDIWHGIIQAEAQNADNALEAEYYGLLTGLKELIEFPFQPSRGTLEIIPQHADIGHQLLNSHKIDSVSLYHLRAKVFELMSKFKFVSIGWKEQ